MSRSFLPSLGRGFRLAPCTTSLACEMTASFRSGYSMPADMLAATTYTTPGVSLPISSHSAARIFSFCKSSASVTAAR